MTNTLWIAACFGIFIIGGLIGFAVSTWMIMAGDEGDYDEGFSAGVRFVQFGGEA